MSACVVDTTASFVTANASAPRATVPPQNTLGPLFDKLKPRRRTRSSNLLHFLLRLASGLQTPADALALHAPTSSMLRHRHWHDIDATRHQRPHLSHRQPLQLQRL
eukprot:3114623-Rhodomonas_salina.1